MEHSNPPTNPSSRTRYASQRDASYKPSRDETRPRPTAAYDAYDFQHLRKRPEANVTSGRTADRYYDPRYDSRFHHPPTSPTSARRSQRSPQRKRRSWPPQPFAEDEATSLTREANAHKFLQEVGKDEVQSRGTVDQEPVIVDVPQATGQYARPFGTSDQKPFNTGILTPPTSEDERVRKARRKPSKLNIKDEDVVPEVSSRTASPYAFSKSAELRQGFSSSERLAATSSSTPSSLGAGSFKNARFAPGSRPSSPQRDSARFSGADYFNSPYNNDDETAIDDSGYDSRQASVGEKNVTGRPWTESPRVSAVDLTAPLAQNAPPIRKLNLDARRNTDTQNTLPNLARLNVDMSRRPTPLMATSSLRDASGGNSISAASLAPQSANPDSRSRQSSYASSRGPSPTSSLRGGTTPPSRSPRASAEFPREGSAYGSKPPSASSSRPASPTTRTPLESPRLVRADLDWNALLTANAVNATRRAKPSSRLSTSVQQESMPDTSRRSAEGTSQGGSLPYPEDSSLMGGVHMPAEQDHAYYPTKKASLARPFEYDSNSSVRSASPAVNATSRTSTRPARPNLTRGYSANAAPTAEPRSAEPRPPRPMELKRTESFATTSDARKEIAALMKKGLPPCPRPEPTAGYDDWYTVAGATNIDFCPDCIGTLFERTAYRPHFRRSLPRNLDEKVQCAFGSAWIRLAWLLTLQQHRTDLCLLKDLAEIDGTTDPCPGAVESLQSWYGLRDPEGRFVRDFHVCFSDVRKIERLLPTLAGMFVKLPQRASYEKQTCAIRTESNRFSTYLDALVSTHEKAVTSRKGADPMPLVDLVEHKTRLRECTRDVMLVGGLWHFIPDVPTMTVCEDCFESVVEPGIKQGFSLAKKFNRTVQPVYGEGIGSSCQLYSRRMRKVFQRALEDADLKYLSRKSKERRDMELYLQDKYKDVMAKAKRLSWEGSVSESDERRLTRDLEKISAEWKSKWE